MITIIFAAALAAQPKPPAPPSRFDLLCVGTKTHSDFRHPDPTKEDWRQRIAIDLDAHLACFDDCKQTASIKVLPSELVLIDQVEPDPRKATVDRTTGRYVYAMTDSSIAWSDDIVGQCSLAPFTPMPKAMF